MIKKKKMLTCLAKELENVVKPAIALSLCIEFKTLLGAYY